MSTSTFSLPAPTQVRSETFGPPAKGFAVAALVTGIVGSVFGLVPLLAMLALPLGIVALVFGLLAVKRNKRSGHPVGMARAGWILGLIATVLAIIGFAVVNNAVDDLEDDLDRLEQDYSN